MNVTAAIDSSNNSCAVPLQPAKREALRAYCCRASPRRARLCIVKSCAASSLCIFTIYVTISHPNKIYREEMILGNPWKTREYQNTARSTLLRGKNRVGIQIEAVAAPGDSVCIAA